MVPADQVVKMFHDKGYLCVPSAFTLIFISVALFLECQCADNTKDLIARTTVGTFRGKRLTSMSGHSYVGFRGIPYALPPVQERRFQKPVPYPKIDGVLNAMDYGPMCLQAEGVNLETPGEEDCLNLNVFVPTDVYDGGDAVDLKKVFVYIHGGAYFMGSAREFVPGDLVASGDIIAVTFNYRLYYLGFFKGRTAQIPGNMGLWDQLLVLRWVKKNIRAFGGDPDSITIGGNSKGSFSVSALTITPHTKGLFNRAIMLSGGVFLNSASPGSNDHLLDHFVNVSNVCKEAGTDTQQGIEETVDCLKHLDEKYFARPVEMGLMKQFYTIDGDFFPFKIKDLILHEDYLEKIGFYDRDYLLSVVNNEGPILIDGPFTIGVDSDDVDFEKLGAFLRIPPYVTKKVYDWFDKPENHDFKTAEDFISSVFFKMPADKFLETFASKKGNSRNAYLSYFNHFPDHALPQREGILHAADLCYVLDLPLQLLYRMYYFVVDNEKTLSEEDLRLRQMYTSIFVDFIKTGQPGKSLKSELGIDWPAFNLETEYYLNFNADPTVGQYLFKSQRVLWKDLYPQFVENYQRLSEREEL